MKKSLLWALVLAGLLCADGGMTTKDPMTFRDDASPALGTAKIGPGSLSIVAPIEEGRRSRIEINAQGIFLTEERLSGGFWLPTAQTHLTAKEGTLRY